MSNQSQLTPEAERLIEKLLAFKSLYQFERTGPAELDCHMVSHTDNSKTRLARVRFVGNEVRVSIEVREVIVPLGPSLEQGATTSKRQPPSLKTAVQEVIHSIFRIRGITD